MKKQVLKLMALTLSVLMLASCGANTQTQPNNETGGQKLKVVSTIFPQYDWVRQILGTQAEQAELTLLMGSGIDMHSYQPTTDDIIKISTCDLFLYVGGESDSWVEDALKTAKNPNMVVVNLLDVLGDSVKAEEVIEGMEHTEHSHGPQTFEDSEVQDRTLTDWSGQWQSIYPYLLDGTLDEVLAHKAENSEDKTAEQYFDYYKTGYQTETETITIDQNSMTFYTNGTPAKAEYVYRGYEILTYESGNKGVRYQFEAISGDDAAPRFVQFSDHLIGPEKAEHFHIYAGNDSFAALLTEMDNWPTYYPAELTGDQITEEMLGHGAEEEELDEHVWLSLRNAQVLCSYIADQLAVIDPSNAALYQTNVQEYTTKLDKLDKSYQAAIDSAKNQTLLFGDRFPFRYLVDDYGLTYYAAFPGCSAETEASFETIVFLADKVNELQLQTVMVIEGSDQSVANTIVQSTNDKNQTIYVLNSVQSVTNADIKAGVTYLSIMESNLEVLKQALN